MHIYNPSTLEREVGGGKEFKVIFSHIARVALAWATKD